MTPCATGAIVGNWEQVHDGEDCGSKYERPPRKYPSRKKIRVHWNPYLAVLGREVPENSYKEGPCFSCGCFAFLTRAHIIPRVCGGSDEVGNFHLLCFYCDVAGNLAYYEAGDNVSAYFKRFEILSFREANWSDCT